MQEKLRRLVRVEPLRGRVNFVAGADVAYVSPVGTTTAFGSVVVVDLDRWEVVEQATAGGVVSFPYVPGLLSFREAAILLAAFARIHTDVDVVLVDGHGVAHPRRFGLASHIGLLLDKPTVGCAKKPLVGGIPFVGERRGDWQPVEVEGQRVGAVVRTRSGVKPVFVSIGHRIDLEGAVEVVLRSTRGVRLPEPLRLAHRLASEARRVARPL